MKFEEWRDKQGFPVTSTQEPLWRECWNAALESAKAIVRDHAVDLNSRSWPKMLILEEHGDVDAVRYAYARAINSLKAEVKK